jgi:hypothetical protein
MLPAHRGIGLFLGIAALACSSCGSGGQPVYPVQGKVLYLGKPTPGAVVVFHPAGNPSPDALRPQGTVSADGSFRLTTYQPDDGAPPGDYDVTILWTRPSKHGGGEQVNLLPPRYLRPRTSRLRVQVKAEPNDLPPFKLTR